MTDYERRLSDHDRTREYEQGHCEECGIDADHPDWPCRHALPPTPTDKLLRQDGQPEIFGDE